MEIVSKGEINLYFITSKDIENKIFVNKTYNLLLEVNTELDILQIKKCINNLLNKNCYEIFSIGKYSEKMHDTLDDYVIDKEIENSIELNILTTWDHESTIDDLCF
jgi:hypothetical protein